MIGHLRSRQRGVAMLEFHLIAISALLPLILGVFQIALLLSGFHVLHLAAAGAARAGAVGHAQLDAMRSALGEGLMPLLVDLTEIGDSPPAGLLAEGRLRGTAEVARFARIERLAPNGDDFADHARVWQGRTGIPNDALEFRDSSPGARSGRSVQASNHLRIRVRYCHALVVPLVDALLLGLLRRLDTDAEAQICYLQDRIPLRVTTTFPMQSEAWP